MSKHYYRCVEIEDQARLMGLDLWGCNADGSAIRVAPAGSPQPTGTMTREEITSRFSRLFAVEPIKPHSCYLRVVRKEGVCQ